MNKYQELYLWLNKLELNLKRAIRDGFLNGWSKIQVTAVTNKIIEDGINKIPSFLLKDKNFYEQSLIASRNRWLFSVFNDKLLYQFALLGMVYVSIDKKTNAAKGYIDLTKRNPEHLEPTPFEIAQEVLHEKKSLFRKSRGQQYLTNLRRKMRELAQNPLTDVEFKKRKLSLFTKAELQLRYEEAWKEIESFKENGIQYAYISSHKDCSERCYPFQGKLVDLFNPSINNRFETGEIIDGRKVYSLTDILSQTDKYGYHNTILIGFNCRHYLIPYTKGKKAPKRYAKRFVNKKNHASSQMREMERNIKRKRIERLIIGPIDKNRSKELKIIIDKEIEHYYQFAQKKYLKPLEYRFAISKIERQLLLKEV